MYTWDQAGPFPINTDMRRLIERASSPQITVGDNKKKDQQNKKRRNWEKI